MTKGKVVYVFSSMLYLPKYFCNRYMQDPHDNRISQWLNQTGRSGVFSSEFLLSDHPPLGDWTIQVDIAVSFRNTCRLVGI